MKELSDIFSLLQAARSAGERFALATLVKVQGSSYRRVGAKMLVTESGKSVGAISGGCLESDVQKKCLLAMQISTSLLSVYDALDEEDIQSGFGLGCNGVITVLIEPSTLPTLNARLGHYENFLHTQQPTTVATIYSAEGVLKSQIGKTLCLMQAQDPISNIEHHDLAQALCREAQEALAQRYTTCKQYSVTHGAAEVLIETLLPPMHLVIFGAGYDAVPLVKIAKELSWRVSIIDYRASYLAHERLALADRRILTKAQDLATLTLERECTAAVLLSHNFEYDVAVLAKLLPLQLPYLGVLGPKRRTEKLLAELQKRQLELDDSHLLENLYAPVGLDIGAELPEEIALAILAEIKAVMMRRKGSFLRERNAPIHETH